MRVTKGHSNNRRAHHALAAVRLSVCSSCGANHERHKVCLSCGMYRGNQVMEIKTKKNLVTEATEIPSETKDKKVTKKVKKVEKKD
jgi:large subunit ribosomal protein L32